MHAMMTVKAKETVIAFMGISQPGRTRASHGLNGGPPSRAKDHSCRELVVTVFTAQVISRMSITAVKMIVALRDRVALRRTSTYG